MKTIYSLKEFHEEVLKLAAKRNETYTNVEVKSDHNRNISFRAYINGLNWHTGNSMEECLQKLKDTIEPPIQDTNNQVDVEIELSEEAQKNAEEVTHI